MTPRAILAALLLLAAPARAATPFDGAWTVSQACPDTADGIRGYRWTYPALIRDGELRATHLGATPHAGSLRLSGRIRPDGTAFLAADGQTGDPAFAVGHVNEGYTVHYTVTARFTQAAGTGIRNEHRRCDFTFTRD